MTSEEKKYNEDYLRAADRVEKIKGFYSHALAYVVVIPFLVFVNYMTYWDYQWFWFPMIGWGIGLSLHALMTFGISSNWEERKIKELMNNDKFK